MWIAVVMMMRSVTWTRRVTTEYHDADTAADTLVDVRSPGPAHDDLDVAE